MSKALSRRKLLENKCGFFILEIIIAVLFFTTFLAVFARFQRFSWIQNQEIIIYTKALQAILQVQEDSNRQLTEESVLKIDREEYKVEIRLVTISPDLQLNYSLQEVLKRDLSLPVCNIREICLTSNRVERKIKIFCL